MIRVLVVDDEALVRSGLSMILNAADGIEAVGATDGRGALHAVADLVPNLVLLDVRMPDVDGLTVLRSLMERPSPPVVAMLTTFEADEYVAAALRAGARGYLVKDTDPEVLPALVRRLVAGGVVLAPRVASHVVAGYLRHQAGLGVAARTLARLSSREREVLVLLAEGLANGDIGRRLHLSLGTVKEHVGTLLAKLGVHNRVQAALWAQRAGLLDGAGV
ncbi:response regulator [Streptomyces sp. NPDC059708]|uniref:response regulator n=1 Tax=Streptomyces sp. NPDC059708 TaxID=3346916 RepID=UPI00369AFD94